MDEQELKETKEIYKKLQKIKGLKGLSSKERETFDKLQSQLAGAMLSSWLPADTGRRVIMLILFLVAVVATFKVSVWFLLLLLVPLLLSPRTVGEAAIFLGKLFGSK